MSKVVIVTDSTAYIPTDLVLRYGLRIVPLSLLWDKAVYKDGVDITPDEFYTRLKLSKSMPSTSQITPEELKKVFAPIVAAGNSVLGIFISSGLSGTMESAIIARDSLGKVPIELVDSHSSAMGLGFPVLTAARAVQGGADLAEAAKAARQAVEGSGVMFVVETLEFLHRGGRIGGARRFVGTALNLKPILEVQAGKVEAVESVRTKSKATERMLDLLAQRVGDRRPLRISPLHAYAEEEGKALMAAAVARFHPEEYFLSECSPVIGTHIGPGTVGIAYCAGF
jgi:DegV family protein with EDD domain